MNIPVGREDIAALFQNSISGGRLSQSYIICADKGMGKKTAAMYIRSLILCRENTSCGSCPSCRSLAKGAHPDSVEIRRVPDKASLGVDDIRAVRNEIYKKPTLSDYKVVTVHEMHLATDAAQNSMLKLIEEPPGGVIFLILTDTMSPVLPTIVSRSVVIDLKPLSDEAMKRAFSATDFEVSVSGGNAGRLIRLRDDPDYNRMRDEVTDAFFSVFGDSPYAPYEASARLDKIKSRKEEVFSLLLIMARDVYYASSGLDRLIINKDKFNYIDALSKKLTAQTAWRITDLIISAQREKGKNGNFSMAITILLLKCRAEMKKQKRR